MAETFQYVYDDSGQLIKVIDSTGTVIEYVYDETGNILEIKRSTVTGLAIFHFTPAQGTPGTTVTIQGQGFSTVPADNAVDFNGTPAATPSEATEHTLSVTVPLGATTGPISVRVGGETATSDSDFGVIGAPEVTSIMPPGGLAGRILPAFSVAGRNLIDSSFAFVPESVPPAIVPAPANIQFSGNAATMPITIAPDATGSFAVVATNPSGSSSVTPTAANTFRILDPGADEDGDGLTNDEEAELGCTDMFDPDSDADGWSDGLEVSLATDPCTLTDILSFPVLGCADRLAGSITAAGERDLITFAGTIDQQLSLVLTEGGNFSSTTVEPRLTVFSPSNTRHDFTLPEDGTYVIRVDAQNLVTTGSYTVGMECLSPLVGVEGTVACGVPFADSIDSPADSDLITFAGNGDWWRLREFEC